MAEGYSRVKSPDSNSKRQTVMLSAQEDKRLKVLNETVETLKHNHEKTGASRIADRIKGGGDRTGLNEHSELFSSSPRSTRSRGDRRSWYMSAIVHTSGAGA